MSELINTVVAYKAIDHCITSADARLSYQASSEQLEYLRQRDKAIQADQKELADMQRRNSEREREFLDKQGELERKFAAEEAAREREHQELMQERALEVQRDGIRAQMHIAKMAKQTADLDREARLSMHAQTLDQNEQLEVRRLRVQTQIANQQEALQRYLHEQGVKNAQELEKFKALAMRETQILLARENAQNTLQDHLVQEALKTFPLNISPIVLLGNRPHSLKGLLRFSSNLSDSSLLPDITQVYKDVKAYSENPEALNVFIAPIHIDSKIQNRENLSQQMWDSIYQNVESFFTEYYNRRGQHPVIMYPTAWRDKSVAGQHAGETLHFFLRDMPCMVLVPRFDGHSFSIMMSSWGIGYQTTDHIRTEMRFDINLDAQLIKAAYERSKKSLSLIEKLGDNIDATLIEKKKSLEKNIRNYETLDFDSHVDSGTLSEIEALGVYSLFDIDPIYDMAETTKLLSSLLTVNLAIMADIHHLQSTDAMPIFPKLFGNMFQGLYSDRDFREIVSKCYERVFIFLRNSDASYSDSTNRRELERVREMQITNLQKQLELINQQDLVNSIEDKLRKYAEDKYRITGYTPEQLWAYMIDNMTIDDIPFFKELLPNIEERRRYKIIDKRIAELQR